MATANLQIDYVQAFQEKKEVTANEAIDELDAAIGGTLSKTITTADVTLTGPPAQNSEAMKFRHVLTGAMTAARNYIVPVAAKKFYLIEHQATGGFVVTVKTTSGTGIKLVNGEKKLVYCDGVNVMLGIAPQPIILSYQVENLAANADIGDGTAGGARVVYSTPRPQTLTKISILSQAAPAGIDDSNTCVIKIYRNAGATPIVNKTYNTGTSFPAINTEGDLGTLDATEKVLAKGDQLRLEVTNGATADPPAFMLQVQAED